MYRKFFILCIIVLFTACAYRPAMPAADEQPLCPAGVYDDLCPREQLVEMGWCDERLDAIEAAGISFESTLNQARFIGYAQKIYDNLPIGPSGEIILPQYRGEIYFDNRGILTVTVLDSAFNHAGSATAIEEMRELGIIVRRVQFSYQELRAATDILNQAALVDDVFRYLGFNSWGVEGNRVTVAIDPYTDEKKAKFNQFLLDILLDPAMFAFRPAVTQAMIDARERSIANAVTQPGDQFVPVGDIYVTRTGIAFSLENRAAETFFYGLSWDLAYYANGIWRPVPYMPGVSRGWLFPSFRLQSGGIQQYREVWEWRFGKLPPGRYMFIRDGRLDESHARAHVRIVFYITEDSPAHQPPPEIPFELREWTPFLELVEYSDITPTGVRVVVANVSRYNISDHKALIDAIVPEQYTRTGEKWEWHHHRLPFVNENWFDYQVQGKGDIPIGGQLEFAIDWSPIWGKLEPGKYVLVVSLFGTANPPHPTGLIGGSFTITLII